MPPVPFVADATRYDSMTYRRTGRSGLDLPALSLGLWHNFGDTTPLDTQRAVLRRAGLDYHDLAHVVVHPDLEALLATVPGRVFAFTTHATKHHTDLEYRADDVLLFGPEPTGLPEEVLAHPRITAQLRIPMLPGRRSMNLSNAAAVATYEAWRQLGFEGGV
jgi:tRNA (cytidine/uridine-2'-O-)-methyltransferase